MKKLPNTIKYALFLVVLCLLAGGLLALVNSFTNPIITERNEKLLNDTLKKDFEADKYQEVTEKYMKDFSKTSILNMYFAGDSEGNLKYIIYKVSKQGYGGPVVSLVAINVKTEKFEKVSVVDVSKETKNIGDKVVDFHFGITDRKVDNFKFSKHGEVRAGSTVSSNAVASGIQDAADHYNKIKSTLSNVKVGA